MSEFDCGPGKTILLVEDEVLIAMAETAMLRRHGFDVLTVHTAESAIAAVAESQINLVLMDIELGEGKMDGTEAALCILRNHDIPIVFLSSHTEPEIVEKTGKISSYGYVVKNSGETVLLASISMALKLFESRARELAKEKLLEADNRQDTSCREFLVHVKDSPVHDEEGNLTGVTGISSDISEQRRILEELRVSEEKYRALYDNAPLAYQSLDENGNFIDVNPAWLQILGYERGEVIGRSFGSFLHPDWKPHFEKNFPAFKKRGYVHDVRFRIRHRSGEYRDISFEGCIGYNPDGTFRQTYCVFKDITEAVLAEAQLSEAVLEKENLLQEMNHRIKNNLMMISSLISLKQESFADQIDLSDLRHQIDAIRIVHEKLYQSTEIKKINLEDYVEDLISTVFSFCNRDVVLNIDIKDIVIHTRTIVPLGLIINEVATNAVKYGFPSAAEPGFSIGVQEDTVNKEYILIMSNNGAPFPQGIDLENPATLGLRLISALVRQLNGVITLDRTPHPVFTIRFPAERPV